MELVFDASDSEQLHTNLKFLNDFGDTLLSINQCGLCSQVLTLPFFEIALRETFLGDDEGAKAFNGEVFA